MGATLFTPHKIGPVELANRIVVAPMCQYSAVDGTLTDWHLMHLGQFGVAGNGLVFIEATGVEAAGRITPGCVGLYNDENEAAIARIVKFYADYGNSTLGIQLAHAGRKASSHLPWDGGHALGDDARAWQTFGPSALAIDDGWHTPTELDADGLNRIKDAWVQAAKRAVGLGIKVIEVHAAHGYLLHSFMSPLSNKRQDEYGGSLENRLRYPLEIFKAVQDATPDDVAVGIRISATDWVEGGWNLQQSVELAKRLKAMDCHFIDVSSGGNSPAQKVIVGAGYQTGFAAAIKKESGLTTMAVGMITHPHQAETILKTGQADFVALARRMLYDPHWAWHAAEELRAGEQAKFPVQYARCHPSLSGMPVPSTPPKAPG